MTVVTRDAVKSAASGVPETEAQRSTASPATTAADLVREFPRRSGQPVRAHRGRTSTVAQRKVHGR
ncbi:hypothetical protein Stsp01_13030 [Streptomyces sp. NBRC 13847]|nr:hypothetical protein Stsp01_13030 [Streptomyces sp. NBRC 13847]